MMNKISIIVPIYNVEKYIQQCIDSILSQTYANIEIVLVDDGSPDKSGLIADQNAQKDSRIKVIHKKNKGVSAARNSGIEAATGDYICFSDGDDWLEPNYIEYLYNLIVKNDADASATTLMTTTFCKRNDQKPKVSVVDGREAAISILCYNMPIGVYCKMFKKSLLENVRFENELFIGEGFNFNTDAFQRAKKVAIGNQSIYHYRRDNEDSAMTKFNIKKIECALYAIERIEKKLITRDDDVLRALKFANWHTHCDMMFFIDLASAAKENEEVYRNCYKIARKDALTALLVPTRNKEKIRALLTWIYPRTIAILMKLRKKRHARVKKHEN